MENLYKIGDKVIYRDGTCYTGEIIDIFGDRMDVCWLPTEEERKKGGYKHNTNYPLTDSFVKIRETDVKIGETEPLFWDCKII